MSERDITASKEVRKLVNQLIYSGATLSQLVDKARLNEKAVKEFDKAAKELLRIMESTSRS